jgi:hypothetical protein
MINNKFSFVNTAILCTSYQTTRCHIPEDNYLVTLSFRGHVASLFFLKWAYWKKKILIYICETIEEQHITQEGQRTCSVTLWRVRVTIVSVENQ